MTITIYIEYIMHAIPWLLRKGFSTIVLCFFSLFRKVRLSPEAVDVSFFMFSITMYCTCMPHVHVQLFRTCQSSVTFYICYTILAG